MNDVKLFSSKEFGAIRTVLVKDKVWFVAKDVAECLGYTNHRDAINSNCRRVVKQDILTNGGMLDAMETYLKVQKLTKLLN